MNSVTAYLGLGGNLGDVKAAFAKALSRLDQDVRCEGLRCSPLYRTSAWGVTDQPDFLNLVVEVQWNATMDELANLGFRLEEKAGRDRGRETHWGPRPLDVDILVFGDERRGSPWLTVPHPHATDRRFVLTPFAELQPDLVPPGWPHSVAEALKACEDEGQVEKISDGPWEEWRGR